MKAVVPDDGRNFVKKAAKWVSRDVLKELTGEKVQKRLGASAPEKKARKKRPK